MAILSDGELLYLGSQIIEPFDKGCVQPASYDLALHADLLIPPKHHIDSVPMDLRKHNPAESMVKTTMPETGYVLVPGGCVLGCTVEIVKCPMNLAARVEGKSSLGRLFLAVHVTAGFIDPGFGGQVTLEIVNHGPMNVVLWPGMKIAQVNYTKLDAPCKKPYGSWGLGSHYQGQKGPTPAAKREK